MQHLEARGASIDELKALWLELTESPLKTAEGYVFQYSRVDEALIRGSLPALEEDGGELQWRQLNNDVVASTHAQVVARLAELDLLRSRRGIELNEKYMELKVKLPLLSRDLVDWKKQVAAAWWE